MTSKSGIESGPKGKSEKKMVKSKLKAEIPRKVKMSLSEMYDRRVH